jgi:formylglycine-generating enzyme required for sulfatase activity
MRWRWAGSVALVALFLCQGARAATDDAVRIPSGSYVPFYARESAKGASKPWQPESVNAYRLDRYPVTNRDFLDFVRTHPQWSRSRIAAVFADGHYLASWASDFALRSEADADRPVTNVSWFAASAYCRSLGKSLPTTDQWEYALADGGRDRAVRTARILSWYAAPSGGATPAVQTAQANGFGVHGLFGLVWEWTLDFNSFLSGSDLRGGNAKFCGGASLGASDPSDYASFMRYAMRTSLKASYTTKDLGFRCASSA